MKLRAGSKLKSCLLAILLVFSTVAATITLALPTSAITIGDGSGTNVDVTRDIVSISCNYSDPPNATVYMSPDFSGGAPGSTFTATYVAPDVSESWCKAKIEVVATALLNAEPKRIVSFNMNNLSQYDGGVSLSNLQNPGNSIGSDGNVVSPGTTTIPTDNETNEDDDENADADPSANCFSGARALGWILCPVLIALSDGISQLYNGIIEPFLNIDTRLFTENTNGTNSTLEAWYIFQTIANIAFIVVLLIVIFSQFTGFGIDNYGIKRLLPRLIVAAILINLSYIICQLAIDISNILGFGLRELFASVPVDQPTGKYVSTGGAYLFSALAVGLLGGLVILSAGWAVLLSLLLAFLGALISLFFMFVLLGVRQAGVVLLTVLAPLALVCYLLPNTQSIFDRWKNMFIGLLLLFPICGLLIGGGELASRILLSTQPDGLLGFFVGLIAMLLNVIPFFLIPTLLKSSFAAMGNIGSTISGIGSNLSRGATGKIRDSDAYKSGQVAARARDARRMQGVADSKFGQSKVGGALFNRTGQKRARARALSAELEQYGKEKMADNLLTPEGQAAARASIEDKASADDISNRETALDSLIAGQKEDIAAGKPVRGGVDLTNEDALIQKLHNSKNKNEQYAIARHLSGYKYGVDKLSDYVNNNPDNVFSKDRGGFSSAMRGSKNFGNVGKFSPELEEYVVNTSTADMNAASVGASMSAAKISTATKDSIQRMWSASENDAGRRQQLIDSMRQAISNPNTSANIKEGERAEIDNLLRLTPISQDGTVLDIRNGQSLSGLTDVRIEEIFTNPNSSPDSSALAEREMNARKSSGKWTGS